MARESKNIFEKSKLATAHEKLVRSKPVGREAILGSLAALEAEGNRLVKAKDLGVIKFAISMSRFNNQALALNEAGNVQPPFEPENIAAINAQNDTFQIFIDNDPGAATPPAPTDTGDLPTSGRKGT